MSTLCGGPCCLLICDHRDHCCCPLIERSPLKNERWVDLQDPSRKGPLRNPESVGDVVAFRDLQFDLDDPPRKDPLRDPADPEPEGGVATRDLQQQQHW